MPTLEITVPRDLEGAEECLVVTWFKQVGDPVKKDEALVILQAEKVSFEIPAPADGVLTQIVADQGDVVALGQVLARMDVEAAPQPVPETPPSETRPASPKAPVRASPIAKRLAREHGIDLAQVPGSGAGGRITEKDVQAFIEAQSAAPKPAAQSAPQPVRASPVARRLAREQGIDLSQVQGSGGGGRITEKDVRAFIEARSSPAHPTPAAPPASPEKTVPMAGIRAAIARRMSESLHTMAQLTLFTEADVTELVAHRETLKSQAPVTYTDLLVRAAALALRQHPHINVILDEDAIRILPDIHIGIAVAVPDGLVVPVIRDADKKSPAQLARERAQLVERARSGRLTTEEMSGGTFTVTNLGVYEIDGFTPIINPPEAAILGVGRIVEKVVVHRGKIAQRSMMTLSLTIDHRLVDGAPGAAFLQTIKRLLEAPDELG